MKAIILHIWATNLASKVVLRIQNSVIIVQSRIEQGLLLINSRLAGLSEVEKSISRRLLVPESALGITAESNLLKISSNARVETAGSK